MMIETTLPDSTSPLLPSSSRHQDNDGSDDDTSLRHSENNGSVMMMTRTRLDQNNQDDNEEENDSNDSSSPHSSHYSLTTPLWLLYCLHGGFTVALPITAIMFMINTQVQVPLSLLPIFGAIEFLPFSFKPLYVYFAAAPASSTRRVVDHNNDNAHRHSSWWIMTRQTQMALLFLSNAVTLLIIPLIKRVGPFMVLGFIRGITIAWPEMLMDLALIQQAEECAAKNTTRRRSRRRSNGGENNDINNSNNNNDRRRHAQQQQQQHQSSSLYATAAARLQAQQATARNVGSVTASLTALALFGRHPSLNLETATFLFGLTALTSVTSAVIAIWFLRVDDDNGTNGTAGTMTRDATAPSRSGTVDVNAAATATSHGPLPDEERELEVQLLPLPGEAQGRRDLHHRDEETTFNPDDGDKRNHNTANDILQEPQMHGDTPDDEPSNSSFQWNREAMLVAALQVAAILLVVRQPMRSNTTGSWLWGTLLTVCLLCMIGYILALVRGDISWSRRHGVALFLILRHLVPSAEFLINSYRYTVFKEAPFQLQLISLQDMVVLTIASWSFGQCLSGYCSRGRLGWVIAGTTALAALGSLSELWFIRVSQTTGTNNNSHWGLFAVASIAHAIGSFTGEWSFLPDVVLSTVHLHREARSHPASPATSENGYTEVPSDDGQPQVGLSNAGAARETTSERERGILYGSYMTCIDFGDQLGGLLAGVIVSAMHITRENNWERIDDYIVLLAITSLGSLTLLVLLR